MNFIALMLDKKPVCAHYASSYLPLTENWIHKLLTNHVKLNAIFLTRKRKNREMFHFEPIISLDDFNPIYQGIHLLFFKVVGYFSFFHKACKKHDVKILHVHFGYHGVKMLGLKKSLGIPMVCSFYGDDAFSSYFTKGSSYENLFNEVDRVLVLGPFMKDQLIRLGCSETKLTIHHLGIDVGKIQFRARTIVSGAAVRFLIASSFLEKKGVHIALTALGVLGARYNFKVDVIGDGPLRPSIEATLREFNLQDRVVLHGYRPYDFFIDMAYQCHVFIQASKTTSDNRKEGTPMAIADVMATGMAVVATQHSDIPEMTKDGETGLLAEENNMESLIGALETILKEPEKISIFGRNGRSLVEKEFNVKIQAERLEQIYQSLLHPV